MPVKRNVMIEYLTFLLDKQFTREELFTIFKNKGIFINQTFYKDMLTIQDLYNQISVIYNNPSTLTNFISATKEFAFNNQEYTFDTFDNKEVFIAFYGLFLDLVNNAAKGKYDLVIKLTRQQVIADSLHSPINQVVIKYDYTLRDRLKYVFPLPDHKVKEYEILPSQKRLLVCTTKFQLLTIDLSTGQIISQTKYFTVFKAFKSLDQVAIVSPSTHSVRIWNAETGHFILNIPQEGTIITMETSKDFLFIGMENGDIEIYNLEGKYQSTLEYKYDDSKQLADIRHIAYFKKQPPTEVTKLFISGHRLIAGHQNGVLKIWDLNTYQNLFTNDTNYTTKSYTSFIDELSTTKIVFQIFSFPVKIWDLETNVTTALHYESQTTIIKTVVRGDNVVLLSRESIDVFDSEGYHKHNVDIFATNMGLLPSTDIVVFSNTTFILDTDFIFHNLKMNGRKGIVLTNGNIGFSSQHMIEIYE